MRKRMSSEVGISQTNCGEIAEEDNEDSKGDSRSFDGEVFYDSDYDFCKDDDNVIYNQSVVTAGRDLSIVLGIKEVGHEEQGIEEPEQHEPHEPGQKHKHVKATAACDVNIFHGEQIQVNEESDSLNSDELNSIYSSSDEEVRPTSSDTFAIKTMGPSYQCESPKKNPGSTVDIVTAVDEISEKERFQRMYICFEALKRSFRERCRPVVGVDGCHLRGPHPGILLTAVGIDPNDCIYPIAYAVVEIENKNSWRQFIEHLKYDLGIYDQQSWTFISDRQKGLGSDIHEILPRIEHRHCVRHLHNNFKKLHPGDSLKARVWACARSHFRTMPKCDILLNNLRESFNSMILEAQEKPILDMLENIRMYLMERLRTKGEWIRKRKEKLCPKIQKKLEKAKEDAAFNIAIFSNDFKFEVTHMYGEKFVVDLEAGEEPESFVNQCYSTDTYVRAYEPAIEPMNGPNAWPNSKRDPIHALKKLKLPGRPKKARRREPDE
ncbi:hypothetical protein ACH5RR_034542 [Cinchona calisaya]|uniref:MULE transposase domain-containing protein n=1 Tax=Cinchona calisaya TaxID=153742 RepID=A0ABD2YDD3_9GENT